MGQEVEQAAQVLLEVLEEFAKVPSGQEEVHVLEEVTRKFTQEVQFEA